MDGSVVFQVLYLSELNQEVLWVMFEIFFSPLVFNSWTLKFSGMLAFSSFLPSLFLSFLFPSFLLYFLPSLFPSLPPSLSFSFFSILLIVNWEQFVTVKWFTLIYLFSQFRKLWPILSSLFFSCPITSSFCFRDLIGLSYTFFSAYSKGWTICVCLSINCTFSLLYGSNFFMLLFMSSNF